MANSCTNDLINSDILSMSFYAAMNALITRAADVREISPDHARDDMKKVGYMLRYLDPHGKIELFDSVRRSMGC